jgi:hypothetical protein
MQGNELYVAMRNLGQRLRIDPLAPWHQFGWKKSRFHRTLDRSIRRAALPPLRQPGQVTRDALFNLSASLAKEGAVEPIAAISVMVAPSAFRGAKRTAASAA